MSDESREERRRDRSTGDGDDPIGAGEDDERYAAGEDGLEGADGASRDDGEWADDDGEGTDDDGHEPTVAGIFGGRSEDAPPRPEIRPESVSPESALFVLLGVLLALFVFYRAATVLAA